MKEAAKRFNAALGVGQAISDALVSGCFHGIEWERTDTHFPDMGGTVVEIEVRGPNGRALIKVSPGAPSP